MMILGKKKNDEASQKNLYRIAMKYQRKSYYDPHVFQVNFSKFKEPINSFHITQARQMSCSGNWILLIESL